ncbi:hypothetical protein RCL1_006478 [Eukaryota sp. TZLM3-RCL]
MSIPSCCIRSLHLDCNFSQTQQNPPPSKHSSARGIRSRPASSSTFKQTIRPQSSYSNSSHRQRPSSSRRFDFSSRTLPSSLDCPTATSTSKWRSTSLQLECWLAEQLLSRKAGDTCHCPIRRAVFREFGHLLSQHVPQGIDFLLQQAINELTVQPVNSVNYLDEIKNLNQKIEEIDAKYQIINLKYEKILKEKQSSRAHVEVQTNQIET